MTRRERFKGEAAYSSGMAGLMGLTITLAQEWASKGIRVNVVLPGDTSTIHDYMLPKFKNAIIAQPPPPRPISRSCGNRGGNSLSGIG